MGTGQEDYDVFISHWSGDSDRVRPLFEALERRGLRVWFDESSIEDHESITESVRDGVAHSKLLVAYYSRTYPSRRACQWELTAAFTAAQRLGRPSERVLVINPERTEDGGPASDHVYPIELRDARFPRVTDETRDGLDWLDKEADRIATIAGELDGVLGSESTEPSRQIPHRLIGDPGFVGRLEDLWKIHSELSGSEAVLITGATAGDVAQVAGLGGVGKSLLAEEYALRFGAAYPGGVIWLSAAGTPAGMDAVDAAEREAARNSQMRTIAARLGLAFQSSSPEAVDGLVAEALAEAGRCLWVVDDLPVGLSSESARAWLAPHPSAKTLITTRSRSYEFASRLDLACLGAEEGFELLVSARLPDTDEDLQAARDIVEDLGGHPLAIRLAAHILKLEADISSFADFRARLSSPDRDELELAKQLRPELPNGHQASIAATLMRSIDTLDDSARDVLRIASSLSSAPIPKWFFVDTLSKVDALSQDKAREVVRGAVHATDMASLTDGADSRRGAVLVHALVSRVVRFRESDPPRAGAVYQAVVAGLALRLEDVGDFDTHAELSGLIPHVREMAREDGWEPPALPRTRILSEVALYDYLRGDYELAEQAQREVLSRYRDAPLFGALHPATISATSQLGLIRHAQGALAEARELQEEALQAARPVLGEEHKNTLSILNNLGLTMELQGDVAEARELRKEILEARRRAFGAEHPETLAAADNLAMSLRAMGEYERALTLQEQTLEVTRRVLGERHRDVMIACNNLAATLRELDELERAREFQGQAASIALDVLGEEHPQTLLILMGLADILYRLDDLEGARELEEQVLARSRRVFGQEDPRTLEVAHSLAETLCVQDARLKASELLKQTLQARRRVLGDEDPKTLESIELLAETRYVLDDPAGAYELLEELLDTSRRVFGEEHLRTRRAITDFANALFGQGEAQRAGRLQEQLLAIYRHILDGDNPDDLVISDEFIDLLWETGNVASELLSEGSPEDARRLEEQLLEVCRRTIGDEHQTTLHVINDLAVIRSSVGDRKGSGELMDELVQTRRRVLGEQDPETLIAIHNRDMLRAGSRSFAAIPAIPHVVRRSTVKLGRNDPCHCGSGKKYKHCHLDEDLRIRS